MAESEEKTHEPTEHRRQEFQDKGDLPRSREISGAAGLILATIVLAVSLPSLGNALVEVFSLLGEAGDATEMDQTGVQHLFGSVGRIVAIALVPLLGLLWLGNAVVGLVQSQGVIAKEPLEIKWETLDIISQVQQKYLSMEPLIELAKGLVKLLVIGAVVGTTIWDMADSLPGLCNSDMGALVQTWHDSTFTILRQVIPVAVVLAVADYGWVWYRHHEKMMMSHQEVKEETKASEGDPHVRSARRQRQRRIAMGMTISNVKKADAVITNPTHFAVALRYRPEEAPAPIVVAKGADALALRIKAEARRHDIPNVENRTVARMLYYRAREGRMIPEALYGPVARVLAVILRKREAKARAAAARNRPRTAPAPDRRTGTVQALRRAQRVRPPPR